MSGSELNESSTITTIVDISKELDRAGENVEKILQLINSLNHISVNMNILKVTKIGKKINKLSQHKDPSVSKAAGSIVKKWKHEIQKKKETGTTKTEASSNIGRSSPPPSQERAEPEKQVEQQKEPERAPQRQRVREADVEYEQKKQEEPEDDDDYDEFISQNYTDDAVRKNIRKGTCSTLF